MNILDTEIGSIGFPAKVSNEFSCTDLIDGGSIRLEAERDTDLFTDPDGSYRRETAPILWFQPLVNDFVFGATIRAQLESTFDAAALVIRSGSHWWGKLAYELSPVKERMIVSVISTPISDDANGPVVIDESVQLRITKKQSSVAMHWRTINEYWNLARYAALPKNQSILVGLSVQSPTGDGCGALFSSCFMESSVPADIRSGR